MIATEITTNPSLHTEREAIRGHNIWTGHLHGKWNGPRPRVWGRHPSPTKAGVSGGTKRLGAGAPVWNTRRGTSSFHPLLEGASDLINVVAYVPPFQKAWNKEFPVHCHWPRASRLRPACNTLSEGCAIVVFLPDVQGNKPHPGGDQTQTTEEQQGKKTKQAENRAVRSNGLKTLLRSTWTWSYYCREGSWQRASVNKAACGPGWRQNVGFDSAWKQTH